jgi:cobalt-zinc-cadmium efflux system protein
LADSHSSHEHGHEHDVSSEHGHGHDRKSSDCAHAHHVSHTHDHAHHHDHGHHFTLELSARHFKVLQLVFGLTCIYLVIEVAGGILSGSLALLADGFHMFADAAGIGLSLFAAWLAHRPAPPQRTFGYQRVEILAAFFNALFLIGMSIYIMVESYARFQNPEPIHARLMLPIAIGGLLVNIVAAKLLHADHEHNLNIKGAYLHVLGDLLGSLGAVAASVCILLWNWRWADPLISMLVSALILYSAFSLLKEAMNVLLEGCPSHIDIEEIRQEILNFEGVRNIHNLHVWNINMQQALLAAHLEVTPEAFTGETLNQVQVTLREEFGLSRVTLQMEVSEECDG